MSAAPPRRQFVVKVDQPHNSQPRYFAAVGINGSEAITAAREQLKREGEPVGGSFHAKPCPLGVVNPF